MKNKIIYASFGFVLFLSLAYGVFSGKLEKVDFIVQSYIIGTRNEFLTQIMKGITYLGNWQFIGLLCLLILIINSKKSEIGFKISIATLISTGLYGTLKEIFGRLRPDINLHLIEQGGLSFPSGHAMNGIVFYGLLIYFLRENILKDSMKNILSLVLCLLTLLIGISRVYLGVHYPTDVIAGWSIGMFFLAIVLIILEKTGKTKV